MRKSYRIIPRHPTCQLPNRFEGQHVPSPRRVLILGCGYVGLELGRQLAAAGHRVFGARRSAGDDDRVRAAGCLPVVADVTQPQTLSTLPGRFDWVVNTVSSSRGGLDEYRAVYLEGSVNVIRWLSGAPPEAYVYTSSTSVYGQTDGSWVDESSPAEPATDTGRILVEAEQVLLRAAQERGFPARLLRVAGIYGPGRGHLFQQFIRGEPCGTGDPRRWLNMIHRDDVAGALKAVLEYGTNGAIYNAADNEPVTQAAFLDWLAQQLGRPAAPVSTITPTRPRKRGLTNKRVSARRLREEIGWVPRYPTFREGYASAVTMQ